MILSVSRRTDIPNYYSEWFYNRIKEGFLYVRNPMNAHQISEIKITPDVVDCIVFWTKNPLPMMKRLNEIKDYNYYFQFTLTGYGNDVEVNLPNKKTEMIPVFQELSEKIGKQKVIWRYDPIFFSDRYTKEYHLKAFKSIAEALSGYTEKCVISFVDIYPKNKKNMDGYPQSLSEMIYWPLVPFRFWPALLSSRSQLLRQLDHRCTGAFPEHCGASDIAERRLYLHDRSALL